MKPTGPRELPAIFTAESVRAILENRKSQTRRLMNPQPKNRLVRGAQEHPGEQCKWYDADGVNPGIEVRPRYRVGDTIWVKEAWGAVNLKTGYSEVGRIPGGASAPEGLEAVHAATASDFFQSIFEPRWRSPLYMPRWASRIAREVTEVRAQRVQAISEEDAVAEGFAGSEVETPREQFASAWDVINGLKAPWGSNPFVFAYTFRRIEK